MKNRSFKTVAENKKSKSRKIEAGVPQGSILGPLLFIFYINSIPKNNKTMLALFADDTVILLSSWKKSVAIDNAFRHFNEIREYFNIWKIKINAAKTELIVFSKKTKETPKSIFIDNIEIKPKNSVKYLGINLDKKLTFTYHTSTARSNGYTALSLLYNLINRKSTLNTNNKMLLCKMIIRPVMLYAAPVWSNTFDSNYNKLEIVQNKILRMIRNT